MNIIFDKKHYNYQSNQIKPNQYFFLIINLYLASFESETLKETHSRVPNISPLDHVHSKTEPN